MRGNLRLGISQLLDIVATSGLRHWNRHKTGYNTKIQSTSSLCRFRFTSLPRHISDSRGASEPLFEPTTPTRAYLQKLMPSKSPASRRRHKCVSGFRDKEMQQGCFPHIDVISGQGADAAAGASRAKAHDATGAACAGATGLVADCESLQRFT